MNHSTDPRVIRTRKYLMEALTELMTEKEFNKIVIKDIVQKAGVNRSTFYLHFYDKQDICTQLQTSLLEELAEVIKMPDFDYVKALNEFETSNIPLSLNIALFEHISENSDIYRTMLKDSSFRDSVIDVFRKEALKSKYNFLEATYISNGVIGLLIYWLNNDMKESIQEMSIWLTRVSLIPIGKSTK